ncbi:MAG: hypothetical protein RLZ98_2393 [Pseudomonadota bacterium]|jgi:tripartite-type tricarboxylate transporter receptor subunit TctC
MSLRLSTRTVLSRAAAIAVLATAFAQHVRAETPAEFYKGKAVTLIISSSPGGGYDTLGRLIAKHLSKNVPGEPNIVVKNMPGAGGIIATNYLYSNAPSDGTTIGGVQNNTPLEPLYGTKQARYDAQKFNWLGSPSTETGLLLVWNSVAVKTLEAAKKTEIAVGSSGANSTPSFYARLMNEVLGTKLKIVLGYKGQNEAFLAMERGEIDGYPSTFYSSLKAIRPDWLTENKVILLAQYGDEKEKELADVPFVPDLVTKPEDKDMLRTAFAPLALGRPYLMPPGVPADRVTAMQDAMIATFKDAAFTAEAEASKLSINNIRSGKQLAETIAKAYEATGPVVDRIKRLQKVE